MLPKRPKGRNSERLFSGACLFELGGQAIAVGPGTMWYEVNSTYFVLPKVHLVQGIAKKTAAGVPEMILLQRTVQCPDHPNSLQWLSSAPGMWSLNHGVIVTPQHAPSYFFRWKFSLASRCDVRFGSPGPLGKDSYNSDMKACAATTSGDPLKPHGIHNGRFGWSTMEAHRWRIHQQSKSAAYPGDVFVHPRWRKHEGTESQRRSSPYPTLGAKAAPSLGIPRCPFQHSEADTATRAEKADLSDTGKNKREEHLFSDIAATEFWLPHSGAKVVRLSNTYVYLSQPSVSQLNDADQRVTRFQMKEKGFWTEAHW